MGRNSVVRWGIGGILLVLMHAGGLGGSFVVRGADVRVNGRLNCPAVPAEGGRVFAHFLVRGREHSEPVRRPLNIAVVIDRSGSMGTEGKIEHAREAVRRLVDRLQPDDLFSIVIYDDVVEVLRPASRVGEKESIRRLIDEISPRGWTNLGGGLEAGLREAGRWAGRGYINRVLLLSDGLANRGVTDPGSLARMARKGRSESIAVSAVGVGLEYNENLMMSLANGGGGNYYYLEHGRDLASIFRREFDAMAAVVAENCRFELELPRGVRFIDAFGWESGREGNRVAIPIGDLSAGEEKEIVVEFDVTPGTGRRTLAEGRVHYQTEGERGRKSDPVVLKFRHTADLADVDRERDWGAQAKADVAQSTRKVEQAMESLDAGRKDEAMRMLQEAQASVAAAPSAARGGEAAAEMKEQETRLRVYQDVLKENEGNVSRAKKSIQYENYKVQRKK